MRTNEEIIETLNQLDSRDKEDSHSDADYLLCEALHNNGLGEIAEAWERARERVGFWYA